MIEFLLAMLAALNTSLNGASSPSGGESPLARDRAAILKQCGCFEVSYSYTETAALKPGYPLRPPKQVKGLEWVVADRVSERAISLQHLLVGSQGVQKHWRQVWDYEPSMLFEYQGNGRWQKRHLNPSDAAGRWAQRVYEVDDSPRYEGIAAWSHDAGPSFWVARAWSPLPRREYTQRSDYDVLARENRHQLNSDGWSHLQENQKLRLSKGRTVPLVQEHGENRYRRVDDARCAAARTWWTQNQSTWRRIQGVWQDVYERSETLHLRLEPLKDPLWQRIFTLAETKPPRLEAEVRAAIRDYQAD
ncbi:hypothetical protein D3C87_904110 [compost metagenome]